MPSEIHSYKQAMDWIDRFDPHAPKVGDEAPEFQLYDAAGENPVQLSDFRGKKFVALVFGSFT